MNGTIFMEDVDPSRQQVNILIWELWEARLDEMVK